MCAACVRHALLALALVAPAAAEPPAPARVAGYRVLPADPSWGAIEGTVRLARPVAVPRITLPAEPRERDLSWRERSSDLVAYDAERLTLADALVFLRRIQAGKDWPEALRAAERTATLTLRDGMLLPHVQWTRTGAWLSLASEQTVSLANPQGWLDPWLGRGGAGLQFNVFLTPGARLGPSDDLRLPQPGMLSVRSPDCCFAWARAHVGVFDHPYVAGPTGLDGVFRLEQVPPGAYELVAWHGPVTLSQPDPTRPAHWAFGPPLTTCARVCVPAGATARAHLVLCPAR